MDILQQSQEKMLDVKQALKQAKINEKATILIEALPYIRKYRHKIVVIKYGGKAIEKDKSLQKSVLTDVALLKAVGIKPILVHGGGPVATKMMEEDRRHAQE